MVRADRENPQIAQQLAEEGRLRLGGRVVDRAHAAVRVGDVLSFALRGRIRVIRVESLPPRRVPPADVEAIYSEVGDGPLTSQARAD